MIVQVKCFTGMRRFAPDNRNEFTIKLQVGDNVARLLEQIGVPADIQPIAAVNGARAERDARLHDGDTVVLFTPMEGG